MHNLSCCNEKNGDTVCCEEGKKSEGIMHDVVCGMEIDPKETKIHVEYKGRLYYFCSIECKNKFESDPEKYLVKNN